MDTILAYLAAMFSSVVRFVSSLIPSPRYVRHLEREYGELKEHCRRLEEERTQLFNGLLVKSGLPELRVGEREPTIPGRTKMTPSTFRQRNEQLDRAGMISPGGKTDAPV